MSEARRVLLISGIDAVGVSRLPALFDRAGYRVSYLGSPGAAVARSRFIDEQYPSGPGPHAVASAAREHLSNNRAHYDWIVLADEPVLWAALDLGDSAWMEGWAPVPLHPASLERLRSKVRFLLDAREACIAVPRFVVCDGRDEVRAAAAGIGFPIFVKATRGLAGSGLLFARNEADLAAQLAGFDFEGPVIAQEEVRGVTGSISVLYDHGRPVCWFSYIMKRTWPNRFSSACAIETLWRPDAEGVVHSIGALTEFHGLAGIDWVLDSVTQKLVVLEFNPRPTPVYYLGPRAGVDFSRALAGIGAGSVATQEPSRDSRVINLFPQALYDAVEHASPLDLLATFKDAPWGDFTVGAAQLRRFCTHYLPKSLKHRIKASTE